MSRRLALLFLACLGFTSALEWWQSEAIYQVYPMSFKDSDGDGVGDLKGIEQQLDYLKSIGIGIVWLSPIFDSPMKDLGYDTKDYKSINPVFGTMKDFESLVNKVHDLGLHLLLDFVPNHSSDENQWFIDSLNKKNGKDDYYVWRNPRGRGKGNKPLPPNNWKSIFGGSAWTYVKSRNQFYLHQFGDYQPDLNYDDPALLNEMREVLRFWLGKGVDGFRVDATPYLVETNYDKDEPTIQNCTNSDPYECLHHIYSKDQNGTYNVIKEFEKVLHEKDFANRVIFNEAYTDPNNTMRYYFNSSLPFNFNLLTLNHRDTNAKDFAKSITDFLDIKPKDAWPNWVIGNHDNSRVATRMGEDFVDAMNALVLLLPGTSVTYYGEEIGMSDTYITDEERDKKYKLDWRAGFRTPMQWNSTANAGFSNSSETWLPANPNYWYLNVQNQSSSDQSHLSIYKKLLQLHKNNIDAKLESKDVQVLSDWSFGFKSGRYAVIINLNNEEENVNLKNLALPSTVSIALASLNSKLQQSSLDTSKNITMTPRSALVLSLNAANSLYVSLSLLIASVFIVIFKS